MPASYSLLSFFFFNDTATTEIYTLSLHDALPIWLRFEDQPVSGGLPRPGVRQEVGPAREVDRGQNRGGAERVRGPRSDLRRGSVGDEGRHPDGNARHADARHGCVHWDVRSLPDMRV